MANLTARLLDPETFEATIADMCLFSTDALKLADVARILHARLCTTKADLESIDDSLSGQESFCGERAVAIESLKARLESKSQSNLKLIHRLKTAKAEGAAEELVVQAMEFEDVFPTYSARLLDRAAAIRKGIDSARAGGGK